MTFWQRAKNFLLSISPSYNIYKQMQARAIFLEENPDAPLAVGEMAAKGIEGVVGKAASGIENVVGVFGKIGSWIKTILILVAVVLGLWFIIRLKK